MPEFWIVGKFYKRSNIELNRSLDDWPTHTRVDLFLSSANSDQRWLVPHAADARSSSVTYEYNPADAVGTNGGANLFGSCGPQVRAMCGDRAALYGMLCASCQANASHRALSRQDQCIDDLYIYGLYIYGLYIYGLYIYGLDIYGLYIYGLYIYGLYIYGLYNYGLHIYGLYSYGRAKSSHRALSP